MPSRRPIPRLVAAALACFACVPAEARAAGWLWPLDGAVVTPYRNGSDPYAAGQHRGIDIAGRVGAPVSAAAGGTVRFAGVAGSSGLTVSVRTADGRFDTSYLHLSSASVRAGARVAAGDRLGAVGTSGARSTAAPHLHFGVRDAGSAHGYRDPLDFLPPRSGAPRAPSPSPVPVGAPVPAAPRARPVRVRPPRHPEPARPRVRVPAGDDVRVPHGSPLPMPRVVPSPHAARRSARRARAPEVGPAPRPVVEPAPRPRPTPARPGGHAAPGRGGPDLGWALACLGLAAATIVGASSIGRRCRTTSPRRSTTSTASPISGTSTPPSPRTSSLATCASAARTSSS